MDRSLGRPLPHQLANPTQAPPIARGPNRHNRSRNGVDPPLSSSASRGSYTVLARVSPSCPLLPGRFLRVTHPFATLLGPEGPFSFDLHGLGLPPTFNLSHDHTLQFIKYRPCGFQANFAHRLRDQKGLLEAQYERPHEWLVFTFLKSGHGGSAPGPRGAYHTPGSGRVNDYLASMTGVPNACSRGVSACQITPPERRGASSCDRGEQRGSGRTWRWRHLGAHPGRSRWRRSA